ncbi:phage baseplate assembly protein V [Variovorax sp. PAMC26660]|uniref:phage baseplate assembly protein V n=1 Tax=Variovorax sp. PAMC26660 TaxID=2762322 RepID=UPI00164ED9F4|nr:phage baseplate assembly protein V [Variovorax sp. PAMC26660]QNK67757.1 phage baseplate assembly protein V [Variovorax sp. PAMC26660]
MAGTIDGMSGKPASTVELQRLIENLVRAGTVFAVDHETRRCRVKSGNLSTNWLPWFARRAGDVRHWSPPSEGEQCMVLSPGGDMATGFVLVGIFSDGIPANGDSGDVERTTYPDGAVIEYDHATSALKATLPEGGTADITVPDSITVHCKTADVTASDSASVHSQEITLDAPKTIATGEMVVQGLLTWQAGMVGYGIGPSGQGAQIRCDMHFIEGHGITTDGGDIKAGDISLQDHLTSDIERGDQTSGRPVAS